MQTTDGRMKGSAVIACFCLVGVVLARKSTVVPEKANYRGYQLWKIDSRNGTALKLLNLLERKNHLSLWGKTATTVDAMIRFEYVEDVRRELTANHLIYEVSIEDIQAVIDDENPPPEVPDFRKGHKLTWIHYHRLEDIDDYLHFLASTFPKLCSIHTIGHSVEGRPIKLLKISNRRPNNRAVFIEGGIHAREWISPAAVTYIIEQLVYHHDYQSRSVRNLDWYIVPVLNPDGYEYTHTVDRLWRKNRADFDRCMGVDLNRNWGYSWGKNGSSSNPCSQLYRGPRPFSEPETAAVAKLFVSNKQIRWRAYISVHSYGQYIVYPWGSPDETLEDSEEIGGLGVKAASTIAAFDGTFFTVGPVGTTIYRVAGTSVDWARGSQNIKYAYTIELRDRGSYGFLLPAYFIKVTSEEALIFVKTIAEAAASS